MSGKRQTASAASRRTCRSFFIFHQPVELIALRLFGNGNVMLSAIPGNSVTACAPIAIRRSITARTTASGADALDYDPSAMRPMVNHGAHHRFGR